MSNTINVLIEQNVPIPPRKHKGTKWAFMSAMEIGDSVFLPDGFIPNVVLWRSYPIAFLRNHPNRKFLTRKVEGGVRIWRVEPKEVQQ